MRSWMLVIARFGAVQVLVQAIGALSSILLVRHLTKADYALFVIANSMQGVMNVLADSGVSVALTAAGGKIWQDRRRMGDLVCTALHLRRKLAAFVALAVVPLLLYLLLHNGAGPVYAGTLAAAVLVGFGYRLGYDVFIVVPRLHSQVARLQWLDLGASVLRLTLLAAFFPRAAQRQHGGVDRYRLPARGRAGWSAAGRANTSRRRPPSTRTTARSGPKSARCSPTRSSTASKARSWCSCCR